jgi:hypothetical protein
VKGVALFEREGEESKERESEEQDSVLPGEQRISCSAPPHVLAP